jgi:periplasmic nitrate reductase NapE
MTLQFASSVLNCLETSPVAMQVPAAPLANRRREILTFFTLAVFIWAFIAVGVVATWGLVVWIYHALTGPPGYG